MGLKIIQPSLTFGTVLPGDGANTMISGLKPLPGHDLPAGFTLVELLVVIVIAAILASLAVPSLRNTVQTNRLDTASNQFAAMLSLARSEAVKQGAAISVSPLPAGNGVNWTGGWTVCCAPGTTGTGNVPVQSGNALASPMTSYGDTAGLVFNATGRLANTTVPANFIFCIDGTDATRARGVTVSLSGRVRVADTDPLTQRPLNDKGVAMQACTAP